jgi:hypothetical protein
LAGREWRAEVKLCAVLEAPAIVASLDDVAVVGQPIEHGGCHFGVAEHLRPIGEGEVGGDQQRGVFVEFADQVEQQLAARLAERQIAEFVDDDEIVAQQLLGQPATTTGGLLLLQLIDEIDQIEEASSGAGANDASRLGSFVRISGSRTATIEVSFNHLVGAGEK